MENQTSVDLYLKSINTKEELNKSLIKSVNRSVFHNSFAVLSKGYGLYLLMNGSIKGSVSNTALILIILIAGTVLIKKNNIQGTFLTMGVFAWGIFNLATLGVFNLIFFINLMWLVINWMTYSTIKIHKKIEENQELIEHLA